jgi:5-carboxymethyl-2-hydroxymuconate isomerase
MPHIHLETTSDLVENSKLPDILELLTVELCSHESIPSKSVWACHTLRSVWCMGDGAPPGFAHCEIALLAGRPLELRQKIATSMMAVMREQFAESLVAAEVGLTLEVREMDRETYQK